MTAASSSAAPSFGFVSRLANSTFRFSRRRCPRARSPPQTPPGEPGETARPVPFAVRTKPGFKWGLAPEGGPHEPPGQHDRWHWVVVLTPYPLAIEHVPDIQTYVFGRQRPVHLVGSRLDGAAHTCHGVDAQRPKLGAQAARVSGNNT